MTANKTTVPTDFITNQVKHHICCNQSSLVDCDPI